MSRYDVSKKKSRNILLNILLLLITIIIFLVLFEISVRVFGIYPSYGASKGMFQKDELLDFRMTPNFKGALAKSEFKIEVITNSLGLRDIEYSAKKSNDFRILALGDSFTWGAYGTSLNQTYLKVLERKLNDNSKLNYQVINAGVPGYGTDQELLYLKNHGYKFMPDLAMLNFFVGNDFLDNMQKGEMTAKDGVLVLKNVKVTKFDKIRSFLLIHFHSYRIFESGIFRLFGDFIQKRVPSELNPGNYEYQLFLKNQKDDIQEQFFTTKELLDNMNNYLKLKNIKFVIVLVPIKYQVDNKLRQIFIKDNYEKNESFDMESPQKVIKEWGLQNNVTVIDLLPELEKLNKNNDFYWKLNPHFNVKGNEISGSIIYDMFRKTELVERN